MTLEEFKVAAVELGLQCDEDYNIYDYEWSYHNLLKIRNYWPVASSSTGGYQGDYLVVTKKDGEYGVIIIGYGSCSGCDALQSCRDMKDVRDLAMGMNPMPVGRTKEDVISYLVNKDWECHFWDDDELDVVNTVLDQLGYSGPKVEKDGCDYGSRIWDGTE